MRIQKYISNAGYCSRRKAEELILEGRVRIGNRNAEIGDQIDEKKAKVFVDGKAILPESKKVYVLINKPKGYVTTTDDPEGRKTVLELVKGISQRVYPVGRLDYDTEGLLLLTNDGDLTNRLTHPSHQVEKCYKVRCDGKIPKSAFKELADGVLIDESYRTAPSRIYSVDVGEDQTTCIIGIMEGHNRQVRKMFEMVGYPVTALKRISIGFLTLDKLKRGEFRHLTKQEVEKLKKLGN